MSSVVERWNRTIKGMIWKYFTANNTTYINVLPEIIDKSNRTYHRTIKCTPTRAQETSNYQHLLEAIYGETQSSVPAEFKVDDRMRIVKKKKTIEKVFTPNWNEELFAIDKVKNPRYERKRDSRQPLPTSATKNQTRDIPN